MQKFDHNYAILTSASSRNAESGHKSCEKSQLLRHPRFPRCADGYARRPLTTCVRITEDKNKKYSHNPALRATEEVIAALNG